MALEWGKEFSFSGLKKRQPKQSTAYPEKRYINLAVSDKKTMDVRRTVITGIVLVVLVALFAKFGVMDFYGRIAEKQAELSAQTSQLSAMKVKLVDYDSVLERYEGYGSLSVGEGGLVVDVMDAFALIDNCISPNARVASVSMAGDTMTLSLTEVSLEGVGQVVSELYEQSIVQSVSVSTATNQQAANSDVVATMTVKLKPAES